MNMNWSQERFIKIQQLLNSWKRRNLTFKGNVVILKSLGISKLIYTAQFLPCPMEWIKAYAKLFLCMYARTVYESPAPS